MMATEIAVIGVGRWGRHLAKNLRELGVLGAIVETEAERCAAWSQSCPELRCFNDPQQILDAPIPAVAIATPSASHFDIARLCLQAGKDVFVEKPMTLSEPQARELVRLARDRERILMVGHLLLYQPALHELLRLTRSGIIGQVLSTHHERLEPPRERTPEDALWALGVHDVAVALFLSNAVLLEQRAFGMLGPSGVQEDSQLHLRFANGMRAHLHVSLRWPERRRRCIILGERGSLVYDELTQTVTLDRRDFHSSPEAPEGELLFRGNAQPVRLEMMHFLERLRDRERPLSDGVNGLDVVAIVERACAQIAAEPANARNSA
ncbi:MAG: Gfo/Idh/MocA family oxidoreductase [Myxococcota bacterium]|jgi:predicted dehydrogenase|nr:Gfo/Idh/MocA family oxidoreductase [Myxococcota bacterium]